MSFFHFRDFSVRQSNAGLKVGTDAMVFGAFLNAEGKSKGLDVGTGTGVLSLMVAQKNSEIHIQAIDIQQGAIEDARFNFQNSPFASRLKEVQGNFLNFEPNQQFDLVFSNPPFYSDAKLGVSDKLNQAKHVNSMTPAALFEKVISLLSNSGNFWIIWPFQTSEELISEALKQGLNPQIRMVLNGKPETPTRVIIKFGFESVECLNQIFTIRNEQGEYTDAYKNLTKDYHNKSL